jgi:ribosomal silencing factor RsfS
LTVLNFRARLASGPPLDEQQLVLLHRKIVEEVTEDGVQWISTTRVGGKSVLRMMIISYLTQTRHVDALAARLKQAVQEAAEKMGLLAVPGPRGQ